MRIEGFVSRLPVGEMAAQLRGSLGKPLVESRLREKLILGRFEGEYYLTVQIQPAGEGSKGIIAVSHITAARDAEAQTRADTDRWLSRMPAGSRLVSQMNSADGHKLSRHLVFSNTYDESLNRDRLVSLLTDEGLVLEREGAARPDRGGAVPTDLETSRTLFFKGAQKEAMATIYRHGSRQTLTVLNVVASMEPNK